MSVLEIGELCRQEADPMPKAIIFQIITKGYKFLPLVLDLLIYERKYYLFHVHLNHQINLRKVFWWSQCILSNLEKIFYLFIYGEYHFAKSSWIKMTIFAIFKSIIESFPVEYRFEDVNMFIADI